MKYLLVLSVLLCSCSSAMSFRGPSGTDCVAITCHGTWSECYKRAGIECPNGYYQILPASTSGFVGELYIKCVEDKNGDGK